MEDIEMLETAKERIIECFLRTEDINSCLRFSSIAEYDKEGEEGVYFLFTLDGGLNGKGRLIFYLEDIEGLVKRLMCEFDNVWLNKWEGNHFEDTFQIEIGVSDNEVKKKKGTIYIPSKQEEHYKSDMEYYDGSFEGV